MAGGNYSQQLYNDYENLTTKYDKIVVELRHQNKQHKADLKELKKITNQNEQLQDDKIELISQLEAAKKEIARLNQLNGIGSNNSGTPTSQTPIRKEKRVPNSRTQTDKKIDGQKGHKRHTLKKFNEDEINAHEEHQVLACPNCQGTVKKIADGKTKDEFDYDKKRKNFNKGCQAKVKMS